MPFCKPEHHFESSLSMEEIESNFKDVDVFSGIMEGLTEAIAYERGELVDGVVVSRRSISDDATTSSKEVDQESPRGEKV